MSTEFNQNFVSAGGVVSRGLVVVHCSPFFWNVRTPTASDSFASIASGHSDEYDVAPVLITMLIDI